MDGEDQERDEGEGEGGGEERAPGEGVVAGDGWEFAGGERGGEEEDGEGAGVHDVFELLGFAHGGGSPCAEGDDAGVGELRVDVGALMTLLSRRIARGWSFQSEESLAI